VPDSIRYTQNYYIHLGAQHHMKVAKRSLLPPSFNLKMTAVGSPQMLLNFYHAAWHHIPEDSTVHVMEF